MPLSATNGHPSGASQAMFGTTGAGSAVMGVSAFAMTDDPSILQRPCVDCGLNTGGFCDYCRAADRFPDGDATGRGWAVGQLTPLCSKCDNWRRACHYCLGIWVTKPVAIYCNVTMGDAPLGQRASYRGDGPDTEAWVS